MRDGDEREAPAGIVAGDRGSSAVFDAQPAPLGALQLLPPPVPLA